MSDELSPAEREAVDRFCQSLGLALRRIMGQPPVEPPTDLPQAIDATSSATDHTAPTQGAAA